MFHSCKQIKCWKDQFVHALKHTEQHSEQNRKQVTILHLNYLFILVSILQFSSMYISLVARIFILCSIVVYASAFVLCVCVWLFCLFAAYGKFWNKRVKMFPMVIA